MSTHVINEDRSYIEYQGNEPVTLYRKNKLVYVAGGTAACKEVRDRIIEGRTVLEPSPRKILHMVNDIGDTARNQIGTLYYHERKRLKDSTEYTMLDLVSIIRQVRKLLKKYDDPKMGIGIVTGTDAFPETVMALAEGISPEELGDRNIIAAASFKHASPNRPKSKENEPFYSSEIEPVRMLSNMLYLSGHPELKGTITGLCGNKLFAPRGLRKEGNNAFGSRFPLLASAKGGPVPKWEIEPIIAPFLPRGKKDEEYRLVQGVERIPLSTASHYHNLYYGVEGMINGPGREEREEKRGKKKGSRLKGIILELPGDTNIRQEDVDQLEAVHDTAVMAAEAGVPVVAVSSPMYHNWGADDNEGISYVGGVERIMKYLNTQYEEHNRLIDGMQNSALEMQFVVSKAVKEAQDLGKKGRQIPIYVQGQIRDYTKCILHGKN